MAELLYEIKFGGCKISLELAQLTKPRKIYRNTEKFIENTREILEMYRKA